MNFTDFVEHLRNFSNWTANGPGNSTDWSTLRNNAVPIGSVVILVAVLCVIAVVIVRISFKIINFIVSAVFLVLQIAIGLIIVVTILHCVGWISIGDQVNNLVVNMLKPEMAVWLFEQRQRVQELIK